jgi:ABC-type multidrug transport system fused ATPase/permease subunit
VQFAILFVFMILASFAEVISIGAIVPFLGVLMTPDLVFDHPLAQPLIGWFKLTEPRELLLPLTAGFALASLLSGAMRLVLLYAQTRLSHGIGADFSLSIYRRTLFQPYAVHAARNSSEVIAAISNKTSSVVYQTLLPILSIFSSLLILTAILLALFAIDPTIALIAFAGFGTIYGLIIFLTRRRLIQDGKRVSLEQNRVIKALQEGLGGIRDVLIEGAQDTYVKIYRDADRPMRRAQANIQIIAGSPRYGIEALGMVFIAVLAYSLAIRPGGILGAISVLGALALGAQRLLPILQLLFSNWSSLRAGRPSLLDALDMLDQPLPAHSSLPPPQPLPFHKAVTLDGLSFRYTDDAPWVLRDINLVIPRGSRIGFVGTTGSGKSTLLDIVMGLLQPSEGQLKIDDTVVTAENHRAWQVHIAHVPQDIFLTDDTIAENIAFGVPRGQIDMAQVRKAAASAQIAGTIDSWELGFDTMVGERGVRLSGGQRQRIGIARALYKKADMLVLDEATSALDNTTEDSVMQAIDSLGDELTVIIVAHRLTTLRKCTQVIELADGRISRAGSYQDIVSAAS